MGLTDIVAKAIYFCQIYENNLKLPTKNIFSKNKCKMYVNANRKMINFSKRFFKFYRTNFVSSFLIQRNVLTLVSEELKECYYL